MKPEEIRPDTELCTIVGYNAQIGDRRKYFNRILKESGINAEKNAEQIIIGYLDSDDIEINLKAFSLYLQRQPHPSFQCHHL